MSTPEENFDVPLDYEETLHYGQRMRRKLVHHMTQGGEKMPTDTKEANVMLKALDGMDKSALERKKNSIDQGNADTSRVVAESMREFIQGQKNRNPFERGAGDLFDGSIPILDQFQLGEYETVPGETEIGVVVEKSGDFMKRMEATRDEEKEE